MMLDDIRTALEQYGVTFYGSANDVPVNPNSGEVLEKWDYTVFRRGELSKKDGSPDFIRYYYVAIVREDFIPDGLEFEIIKSVIDGTNLRVASSSANYSYVFKGGTDVVVEICLLKFSESIKRCKVIGE